MANYRIADILIEFQPRYDLLRRRASLFLSRDTLSELTLTLDDDVLTQKQSEYPLLSPEQIEYMWTGAALAGKLWRFDAAMIHASAIEVDGVAYVFSADSGVGKTTLATWWLKRFGDRARLINDDKPIIRSCADGLYVYGSPFSGTCDENRNARVPLGGILFLKRDTDDRIDRLSPSVAVPHLIRQCGISRMPRAANARLDLFTELIESVPIGEMSFTPGEHAVDIAYQWLKENRI